MGLTPQHLSETSRRTTKGDHLSLPASEVALHSRCLCLYSCRCCIQKEGEMPVLKSLQFTTLPQPGTNPTLGPAQSDHRTSRRPEAPCCRSEIPSHRASLGRQGWSEDHRRKGPTRIALVALGRERSGGVVRSRGAIAHRIRKGQGRDCCRVVGKAARRDRYRHPSSSGGRIG